MRIVPSLILVCCALAGCASRPADLMLPVQAAASAGGQVVPLLVATTRRALPNDPGQLFSGERSRRTRFARIEVSVPPTHKVGEIEWPDASPGDPARNFVVARAESFDREGFRRSLREALRRSGQRQVLVFVHGYNTRFDDSVFRFAQLAHDSGTKAVPVLFTWPSRGRLLAYPYDRESATYSRNSLENLLNELADETQIQDVSILAHSMGNWVTLEALRQQAIRRGQVPAKIHNVMLAAPDLDVDVARTQIVDLGPKKPRMTLFVSQDDRALQFSNLFWSSTARLGSIDPEREPYRTALEREAITVVDLTRVNSGDPLHHAKFAESPEVVRSIGGRLAAGQEIETQGNSLGQVVGTAVAGTTQVLGNTVSAAVTVPFAVVDPRAREDLDERLKSGFPGAQGEDALATEEPGPGSGHPQSSGFPNEAPHVTGGNRRSLRGPS